MYKNNYKPVLLDNLCNSNINVLEKIKNSLGIKLEFIEGDVLDTELLKKIIKKF